jgi:para-aminobenzoate synthetase
LPPLPWDRQPGSLRLHHSKLPGLLAACGGSEALFWHLFGGVNSSSTPGSMDSTAAADTFWLDSVTTDRARFSFMGGRGGGLWRRIEYRLASPQTTHPEPAAAAGAAAAAEVGGAEAGSDNAAAAAAENTVRQPSSNNSASSGSIRPGTLTLTAADGQREVLSTDFFGWLEGLLASHRCQVR